MKIDTIMHFEGQNQVRIYVFGHGIEETSFDSTSFERNENN